MIRIRIDYAYAPIIVEICKHGWAKKQLNMTGKVEKYTLKNR